VVGDACGCLGPSRALKHESNTTEQRTHHAAQQLLLHQRVPASRLPHDNQEPTKPTTGSATNRYMVGVHLEHAPPGYLWGAPPVACQANLCARKP
jgi:hypothetical protein